MEQARLLAIAKHFMPFSRAYKHGLSVGSGNLSVGHAEGTAGLISLIKDCLMYEDGMLYPNHDFRDSLHDPIKTRDFTSFFGKVASPGPWTVSSFGLGGTNAFVELLLCFDNTPLSSYHPEFCQRQNAYTHFRLVDILVDPEDSWKRSILLLYLEGRAKMDQTLVYILDGQEIGKDLMALQSVLLSTMRRLEEKTGIPLVGLYSNGLVGW
eukprot:CAMPEP_0194051172 /NCGR_PEP_ID=MMETSP0009_2-20130614/39042_1 /TAXON_ID=210454 /ORGANISM="Grammatophora oceanica, Strain CCMP 410" /LENGTH=209 /DNA_ID=CAMNT_0038698153 /DNA_START=107 /DNA_END=733 /DNA_ORIENTATION=+